MPNDTSYQIFRRAVLRRAKVFRNALTEMLLGMAATSVSDREEKAKSLEDAAQSLCDILTAKDQPSWLQPIHESVTQFRATQTEDNARQLATIIVRLLPLVQPEQVISKNEDPPPYEFDEIYKQARNKAGIRELFDAHVHALAAIIDSGDIESVTALNALRQLVAALKANRDASYAAVKQSVFLARFIQNTVVITLKKIPGLGILVEAAEKTLAGTEDGVATLDREMNALLEQAVRESLPRVMRTSEIVDQQVPSLPAPANSSLAEDSNE